MDNTQKPGTERESGSIMIALVLIVMPLLILVSSAITTMTTRNYGQIRSIQSEQAMLAVESGIDEALYISRTAGLVSGTNISRTVGPDFSFVVEPLLCSTDGVDNDGDTQVDEADENVWQLTITGTYARATRKVVAYLGQAPGALDIEAAVMSHNPNMDTVHTNGSPKIHGDDKEIDGNDWAFGYNFGALFELSSRTRIGVTYVSKLEPSFGGDLSVRSGTGPGFTTSSELEFTFPQLVRAGVYHELNDQWALLGSVGWEDWSEFDSFEISTNLGGQSIETDWRDTYHFGGGVHYRPTEDWLLQAGMAYDTSPVSDGKRSADIPIDRQIRYAVGVQHQFTESMTLGGAFEYIDLGDARIKSNTLRGDYQDNRIFAFGINMNYEF